MDLNLYHLASTWALELWSETGCLEATSAWPSS